jgi:hypothetical protein
MASTIPLLLYLFSVLAVSIRPLGGECYPLVQHKPPGREQTARSSPFAPFAPLHPRSRLVHTLNITPANRLNWRGIYLLSPPWIVYRKARRIVSVFIAAFFCLQGQTIYCGKVSYLAILLYLPPTGCPYKK